jgi:hypothetical protein
MRPAIAHDAPAADQLPPRPGLEAEQECHMRKTLPETMFTNPEQSRLSILRNWVLDNEVTQIAMNERQFWILAGLQPIAEKPWTTFMGRPIFVPDMPPDAQRCLGVFDKQGPGNI